MEAHTRIWLLRSLVRVSLSATLVGCSAGSDPAAYGSGSTAPQSGTCSAPPTPSSCVYEEETFADCVYSESFSTTQWLCNDTPCAQVSAFAPGVFQDCSTSHSIKTIFAYPESCASWEGAGEPHAAPTAPLCVAASEVAAPTWHPPIIWPGSCSAAQIAAFEQACDQNTSTSASCGTFVKDVSSTACGVCLFSDASDANWGPVVVYPDRWDINFGGCIALLDPASESCGEALQAGSACTHAACDATCPPTATQAPGSAESDYSDCAFQAACGACGAALQSGYECTHALPAGSPATSCVFSTVATLKAFCG
jgi:hypothetical protein